MITLKRNEFYTVCTVKEVSKKNHKQIEWGFLPILLILIIGFCGYLWQTKIKDEYNNFTKK